MFFNVKFYIIGLKVALGPNKIMNIKNFKFCSYFCLLYALSLTNPFYVFDLSFLKMILGVLFMDFLVQIIPATFYNFKTKMLPIPYF